KIQYLITINTGEKQIEFKSLITKGTCKIISKFRPRVANNSSVILIYKTITIYIFIFNVTNPGTTRRIYNQLASGSACLYCMTCNIFIILEKPFCNITGDHTNRLPLLSEKLSLPVICLIIILNIYRANYF